MVDGTIGVAETVVSVSRVTAYIVETAVVVVMEVMEVVVKGFVVGKAEVLRVEEDETGPITIVVEGGSSEDKVL